MTSRTGQHVIRHLRRAASAVGGDEPSDAWLIDAFVSRRDEAAFATLVRRHGPMVLAVCRRVVGRFTEADDAFQATFLVLARKAHSLTEPDLLGGWLHGVAVRTSLEARTRMLRRMATETTLTDLPGPGGESEVERSELLALLDRELGRLGEKYRLPVVLCELEGRSRKDVAELLSIPEGTLSSRLAAARRMLAARLSRRGVAVSVTAVAAILSHRDVSAVLPARLLHATIAITSSASIPTSVTALTSGVLKMMFLKKLKIPMLLATVLGLGVGVSMLGLVGSKTATAMPDDKAKPTESKPGDPIPGKSSILGGWKIVSVTLGGQERPKNAGESDAMYFARDKGYMIGKEGAAKSFKYRLDSSKMPAEFDLIAEMDAQRKTRRMPGIVELKGDTLRMCFVEEENAGRPTEFASKQRTREVLLVLQRDSTIKEPDQKTVNETGGRMRNANDLKQIGLAFHNYASATKKLPTAAITSKDGKPLLSWRVAILPFIEGHELYKQFKLDEPWDSEHNKKLIDKMPAVFGTKGNETHYRVFTGSGTAFEGNKALTFADFTDGTSNTILAVEAAEKVIWTKPDDLPYSADKALPKFGFRSNEKGFQALFLDGSVRFLSNTIAEDTLRALITRNGGEVIGEKREE